jgi:hypothetical protein
MPVLFIIAKQETAQMPINWQTDELNLYHGTLFSYKKEQSADLWYNVAEPWKH